MGSVVADVRSRGYDALGRVLLHGFDEEAVAWAREVPRLAGLVEQLGSLDELAAEHHRVLELNVFPFEGVFRDPDALLGGAVSEQVDGFYRRAGVYRAGLPLGPADHVGTELMALAFLVGAEADAVEDGVDASPICALQARFLGEHLAAWWPPLAVAIAAQDSPLYAALTELVTAMLVDHCDALGPDECPPSALPEPPALLDDPKTGLKDIATFLLTPAWSGWFLSRDEIRRVALSLRLPCGFGNRKQLLTTLFGTAVEHGQVPPCGTRARRPCRGSLVGLQGDRTAIVLDVARPLGLHAPGPVAHCRGWLTGSSLFLAIPL